MDIAKWYADNDSQHNDPKVQQAYSGFLAECYRQYDCLTRRVQVEFVDIDPYDSFEELSEDICKHTRLRVWLGGNPHPIYRPEQNAVFRAVHDFYGHFATGSDFGLAGEIAAYKAHMRLFPAKVHPVLTTETLAQIEWINDPRYGKGVSFPEQKAMLAPI